MRDRQFSSCPVVVLMAATMLGISLLTLELPAQGQAAAVSSVFTNALAERDGRPASEGQPAADPLPAAEGSLWRFEGPRGLANGRIDFGLDAHSGRINEIAISPRDPLIMYATGATGGVWKTTDGGGQWAARSAGWPIQSATAVAIDPNDPNRVFVGTGDYKRLDHVPPFSIGVMRSLDGGLTWEQLGTEEMREYTISRIVIDPVNPQNVLATTGRGSRLPDGEIFRSADGGETWAAVGPPEVNANWDDLEMCSLETFWASATRRKNLDNNTGSGSGLLYRSVDRGLTWERVDVITPAFNLNSGTPDTIQVACNRESVDVFIAVYNSAGARVFATSNGLDWREVTTAPLRVLNRSWAHAAFGVTTNYLFVGGVFLLRAPLGTEPLAFRPFPCGNTDPPCSDELPTPELHKDPQCAVPHPSETDIVFLCTDGGVYRHSAATNASTSLSETLGVTQIYRMDVHPRHGGLVGIGAQDLGGSVSFFGNGGGAADLRKPPNWGLINGGDGRSAAFMRDNSPRVFLTSTNFAVTRYDGGSDFASRPILQGSHGGTSQSPLLYENNFLYYADTGFQRLLSPEIIQAGTPLASVVWEPFSFRGGGPPPATIQSLAVCPTNTQVMYAASDIGEMFYSDTGGTSWVEVDRSGLPLNLPIWTISPSPTNCRDVLVGVGFEKRIREGNNTFHAGDRLFRNTDAPAGNAWTGVHGGPQVLPHAPVSAIVRHPAAPNNIWFVAGDVGVFRTDNQGASWSNATAPLGLPNTLVRDLRLSADGNTLYAGTFGRGVWSMDVGRPAPNVFSVRGTATMEGRPMAGAKVEVSGAGRIRKWLKNTITDGPADTTAPIEVPESATISRARAFFAVSNAETVSLITPNGIALPMNTTDAGTIRVFSLPSASAEALVQRPSFGSWRFNVTGGAQATPSVLFASVDFEFTNGVIVATAPDGEYTIEYLQAGSHVVSIAECGCDPISFDLSAHRTDLDFALIPAVSIVASLPSASEPGTGRFTLSRSGTNADRPLTVSYAIGGTATNGTDCVTLSGTVTMPAGSASVPLIVNVIGDSLDEDTETVVAQLTPASGYTIGQSPTATVQIADNDPLPTLTIANVTVLEGGTAIFTLTLSPVSGRTVSVNYATANGTAGAGLVCTFAGDYLVRSGTRTFAAGTTTQTISVPTCGDSLAEGSETFVVRLSSLNNAAPQSGTSGTATIVEGANPPKTGTFALAPTDARVEPHDRLLYTLTWVVPDPRNWHDLRTIDLRIRGGKDLVLWVRFDEASNTFAVFDEATDNFGPGALPGSAKPLRAPDATLHMDETRVVGSGPTGPGVTLHLTVSVKPKTAGQDYFVEIAAKDDLGNRDPFVRAGTLTVKHQPRR